MRVSSRQFDVYADCGDKIRYELPEPGKLDSFYVMSLAKSGSVLLNNIFRDIAAMIDMPFVCISEELFSKSYNYDYADDGIFKKEGYIYGGWRSLSKGSTKSFVPLPSTIFLVRDIRDVAVSIYFSLKYSHPIPIGNGLATVYMNKGVKSVSKYTLNQWILGKNENLPLINHYFFQYMHNITYKTRLYRYEDIIFRKREWVTDMCEYLKLPLLKMQINEIADRHDLRPEKEDVNKHVRNVRPSNHKEKLLDNVINYLNDEYINYLSLLEYNKELSSDSPICFKKEGSQMEIFLKKCKKHSVPKRPVVFCPETYINKDAGI